MLKELKQVLSSNHYRSFHSTNGWKILET